MRPNVPVRAAPATNIQLSLNRGKSVTIMAFELTIALALLVFTFLFYFVVVRNSKTNKFLQKVPGPKQLPILGNSLDFNLPNDGEIAF